MSQKNITVKEALEKHNCNIPGSDLGKTLVYICFPLIVLFMVSDNFIFENKISSLEIYQKLSILILIACIGLAVYSAFLAENVSKCLTKELGGYFSIFAAKFILMVSILLFFVVVSMWFLVLGGIVSSPFASLLTISPILLTIQWLNDRPNSYDKILWVIKPHLVGYAVLGTARHNVIKWAIVLVGAAPIIVIIVTITVGQILVISLEIHNILTINKFEEIATSSWYLRVYITIYFLSILIAAFGVVPRHLTRLLTKKVFL